MSGIGGGALPLLANSLLFNNVSGRSTSQRQEDEIRDVLTQSLVDIALSRYKYVNLPESMDTRFIEMLINFNGVAVVYMDNDYGKLVCASASPSEGVNMFGNPTSFTIIKTGINENNSSNNLTLKAYQPASAGTLSDAVKRKRAFPIYGNRLRKADIWIIHLYAARLATLDRTLEINTKNARRNKVIKTTDEMKLSTANISRQIDEGVEAINVTGALSDLNFLEAVDLSITPDSYEKLHILRTRWYNEALGLLGIKGANQDKKERLVAAEVSANDDQTETIKLSNLEARRDAVAHINKVFGTDIQVYAATDYENMLSEEKSVENEIKINKSKGGYDNVNVHNADEKGD